MKYYISYREKKKKKLFLLKKYNYLPFEALEKTLPSQLRTRYSLQTLSSITYHVMGY